MLCLGAGEQPKNLFLLQYHVPFLESLATCVVKNWPALIVGPPSSGKTCLVRCLAALCHQHLVEVTLTSGTDSRDLLGGFEKRENSRYMLKVTPLVFPSWVGCAGV